MHGSSGVDDVAVERDFPALHRFFGGYFHQDWQEEYATSSAAVAAYLRDAPRPSVLRTAAELDRVLALDVDDAVLGQLLRDAFDCNYVPHVDELSNRAWLERIRDRLGSASQA